MPIHPVYKPLGITSHDAVARARRLLGIRRVGHAGTLDPLATGVLVLLSEEATKLSPFLSASRKSYLAWVAFGLGTPTLDAEAPADDGDLAWRDAAGLTRERVVEAASAFLEVREQRPPAYSAIKQAGQRSYAAARRGEALEPPARAVAYFKVDLLGFAPRRADLPTTFAPSASGWAAAPDVSGYTFELPPELAQLPCALFSLEVAAGTYVRSFARDLGALLATPAHLAGLVRVAAGAIELTHCSPLEEIATAPRLDPVTAIDLPKVELDSKVAVAVRQGKQVGLDISGTTLLLDEDGKVAAVVEPAGERMRYLRVWQRGLTP